MVKTKIMILGTGEATKRFIVANQDNKYIEIIGIILDQAVSEEVRQTFILEVNKLLDKDIIEFSLSDESMEKADIVFLPEYRRIIPKDYIDKYCIVNCHGGILPKWRGFSANAWAIMNGEDEIGFTIHRVREGLDGGEIFFTKRISIDKSETYADVHDKMLNSIVLEVPKVLYEVANSLNKGIIQPNEGFAYCVRFSYTMGDISGFLNDSSYYVNLWRCMARPLGTGIRFEYKGSQYEVGKVEHGKDYGVIDYIGIPGKVVNIENNRVWVKTKDNIVVLSEISINGNGVCVKDVLKNGVKL